jgi:ABC-2 type transport system ATP-binding protein
VDKTFGRNRAVVDLSMDITRGEIVGLIGPSGCGKTTSVRLMTGVYAPSGGSVRLFGRDPVLLDRPSRVRFGYLPQLPCLVPELSLRQNLRFLMALNGRRVTHKRRKELFDFVELTGHERTRARDASGGMQRRLALAAALGHEPELLFLDEPTAGIDPILRDKFWQYFRAQREQGRTLVVTTQYVGEAASCDRVAVLADGSLLIIDTPDGLRRQAFGGDVIDLQTDVVVDDAVVAEMGSLPFVVPGSVDRRSLTEIRLVVDDGPEHLPRLVAWATDRGVSVASCEVYSPTYDEVFVLLVKAHRGRESGDTAPRERDERTTDDVEGVA